jgi:hypothetical protein
MGKLDMKTSRRERGSAVFDLPPHAAEVAAEVAALADLPASLEERVDRDTPSSRHIHTIG